MPLLLTRKESQGLGELNTSLGIAYAGFLSLSWVSVISPSHFHILMLGFCRSLRPAGKGCGEEARHWWFRAPHPVLSAEMKETYRDRNKAQTCQMHCSWLHRAAQERCCCTLTAHQSRSLPFAHSFSAQSLLGYWLF